MDGQAGNGDGGMQACDSQLECRKGPWVVVCCAGIVSVGKKAQQQQLALVCRKHGCDGSLS